MYLFRLFAIVFLLSVTMQSQDKKLKIEGTILDESELSIPYAAISIASKYIGTSSNEDGQFYLELSTANLLDTLKVSSIGFETTKILVKNFIALKNKRITLKEDVVSLDEISILNAKEYVELAFKNLEKNTVSTTHQLQILNRFFAVEDDKAKFFVEHYIKVKDVGPKGGREVKRIEVVEGRKSQDYRSYVNQNIGRMYPVNFMTRIDPLRRGMRIKDYKWSRIGESSYNGEDIIIIKGINQKEERKGYLDPVLYIGVDSYKVYKTTNTASNVVYIYKENKDGKLYLSYHNHYTRRYITLSEKEQRILKTKKKRIKLSKRNEIIVLGIETDKKKTKTKHTDVIKRKMENVKVKYDSVFWENFNLPPATEYYKKSVKELEDNMGVTIETQFELVNEK